MEYDNGKSPRDYYGLWKRVRGGEEVAVTIYEEFFVEDATVRRRFPCLEIVNSDGIIVGSADNRDTFCEMCAELNMEIIEEEEW